MKIIVVGGTGTIGHAVVKELSCPNRTNISGRISEQFKRGYGGFLVTHSW